MDNPMIEAWSIPLALVVLTGFVAFLLRAGLSRVKDGRGSGLVRALAPAITNLVYVIGAKLIVDTLPLGPGFAKLEKWLDHMVTVFGIIVILWLVRRLALLTLGWSKLGKFYSPTVQEGFLPLLRNLITLFVFFTGGIMILKNFGYDVMSLVTALGVSSLAVGLAAKDTLSNMISGFTLIIDRNLRPGDRVRLGEFTGDVEEIGLRSTRILMGNGTMLIVPNSELVNSKILNLSIPGRAKHVTGRLEIPIDADSRTAREACLAALSELEAEKKIRSPSVQLTGFSSGAQVMTLGYWINEMNDEGSVTTEAYEKAIGSLQKHGITLYRPPGVASNLAQR